MKKYRYFILFANFLLMFTAAWAQDKPDQAQMDASVSINRVSTPVEYEKGTIGLGLGEDYGGIGINGTVFLQQNIGLFAGLGYAFAGVGFNGGIRFQTNPTGVCTPFVLFMYGYNAAVAVRGNTFGPDDNKMFYGPSAGIGLDFGHHRQGRGYFTVALIIPFRSPDVDNYISQLESQGVVFQNKPSPVAASLGYRWCL